MDRCLVTSMHFVLDCICVSLQTRTGHRQQIRVMKQMAQLDLLIHVDILRSGHLLSTPNTVNHLRIRKNTYMTHCETDRSGLNPGNAAIPLRIACHS